MFLLKIDPFLYRLSKLEEECIAHGVPLLGREKGTWLYEQIQKIKPKTVLELGTAWGYSGCILTSADARLTTIDWDWRSFQKATEEFAKRERDVESVLGDVMSVVPKLVERKEQYDLIFMDCEKRFYLPLLESCLILLNDNGHIIIDNIDHERAQDCKERALHHPKLDTKYLQIKDGILFCRKI